MKSTNTPHHAGSEISTPPKYLTIPEMMALADERGRAVNLSAEDFPQPHNINGEIVYLAEAVEAFFHVKEPRAALDAIGSLLKTYDLCSRALEEMNRISVIDARLSIKLTQDQRLAAVKAAIFNHWNTSSLHYEELDRITGKVAAIAPTLTARRFASVAEWDAEQVAEHMGLVAALLEDIINRTGLLNRYKGKRRNWQKQQKIAAREAAEFQKLLAQGGKQHRRNVIEIEQAKAEGFDSIREERESVLAMLGRIKAGLSRLMVDKRTEEAGAVAAYQANFLECPPAPAIIITKPVIDTTPRVQVTSLPWDDPDFEDDADGEDIEYFFDLDVDD